MLTRIVINLKWSAQNEESEEHDIDQEVEEGVYFENEEDKKSNNCTIEGNIVVAILTNLCYDYFACVNFDKFIMLIRGNIKKKTGKDKMSKRYVHKY